MRKTRYLLIRKDGEVVSTATIHEVKDKNSGVSFVLEGQGDTEEVSQEVLEQEKTRLEHKEKERKLRDKQPKP